jgi:hypothetical protein
MPLLYERPDLAYTDTPLPQEEESVDMAKIEERVLAVEHSLGWHRGIGWGIVLFVGAIFGAFLTWYLPKELNNTRELVKADTAAQLSPINVQLARLTAIVEVKQEKDVAKAISNSLNFSGDPALSVATVSAIARQARTNGIKTDPRVLVEADNKLRALTSRRPDLNLTTWGARLELASYRTSLNSPDDRKIRSPQPAFNFQGTLYEQNSFENVTVKLDGGYWRNNIFKNVVVEYDGGPMALENAVFIDCVFQMKPDHQADQLASNVISDSSITKMYR